MSVEEVEWIDPADVRERNHDDTTWRVENESDAAWCIRMIAAADVAIARVKELERQEVDRIRARAAYLRSDDEETRARMRRFLEDYIARTDAKTVRTLAGTVSRIAGKATIAVEDLDAFTSWALDNEPSLLKYQPDMQAARWASFQATPDGVLFDPIGTCEAVPGVREVTGEPTIRITKARPKAELDRDGNPQ